MPASILSVDSDGMEDQEVTDVDRCVIEDMLRQKLIESMQLEQDYEEQVRAIRYKGSDEAEEAEAQSELANLTALLGHTKVETRSIALALDAKATIGECIDCGTGIGLKRLMAMPSARRCVACKDIGDRKAATGRR